MARQADERDNTTLAALEYGEAARDLKRGLEGVKEYQKYYPTKTRIIQDAESKQLVMVETKDTAKKAAKRDQLVNLKVSIGSQSLRQHTNIEES